MLINPLAVRKLRDATRYNSWPNTTHAQRNELARTFLEEAGRLLDHKAETTVKHTVELYNQGEISYERYIELIEAISEEEAVRGASYGEEYARNRVFDFAQKALDRAKEHTYALSLIDAKKQYEIERQKAEQSIKDMVQQYIVVLETAMHQHDADLKTLTQQQKDELLLHQESIRTEIEQILVKQLQEERERREREIYEQEHGRPARQAAQTAIARIAFQEKRLKTQKRFRYGFVVLGCVLFLSLLILLLLFPLPQWITIIVLAVIASLLITFYFWKSTISEDKIAEDKRQIALYQTKSDDYATLSDEERAALLIQRIM